MYFLITDTYIVEGETHTGYGIGYCDAVESLNFEDLTTNPVTVKNLIKLCNDLGLSPIHLYDVVEDFLVEAL